MAQQRKRRLSHRETPKPAKAVPPPVQASDEPLCWLCSRPLASGRVKSMLGLGVFAVHQRCYEEALRA